MYAGCFRDRRRQLTARSLLLSWCFPLLVLLLRPLMSNVVAGVTSSDRTCRGVTYVVAGDAAGYSALKAAFRFRQRCRCEHECGEHHEGFHRIVLSRRCPHLTLVQCTANLVGSNLIWIKLAH